MLLSTRQRMQFARLAWLCCAMFTAFPTARGQSYYGSYYQPNRTKPFEAKLGSTQRQPSYLNPTRDLYNKYYYSRPSVSPYLNLDRPFSGGATAYQTYVRPEQQRREKLAQKQSAYIAQRKQQPGYTGISYGVTGTSGLGATARPKPNAYYNQWYSGKSTYRR
jgi:hypothetical protein